MCLNVNRAFYTFIGIHFLSHLTEPSVFNGDSGYSSVFFFSFMKIIFIELTIMRVFVGGWGLLDGMCIGYNSMGVNLIIFLW